MSNNSNNDNDARSQAANSLDAFRRIAQAQAAAQAGLNPIKLKLHLEYGSTSIFHKASLLAHVNTQRLRLNLTRWLFLSHFSTTSEVSSIF